MNYFNIPFDVFWNFDVMGSVAEWSKALVLGTSLFGGVGSNPTAAKIHKFYFLNTSPIKTGIFAHTNQFKQKLFFPTSGGIFL